MRDLIIVILIVIGTVYLFQLAWWLGSLKNEEFKLHNCKLGESFESEEDEFEKELDEEELQKIMDKCRDENWD